ncbi:hypothetical protein HYPGJ_10637 [Hyphomicrobium sp. GJ21]|nr:hypothetical protein HYPGJ_10637 [Hyphomicrobium sp. GJ21]
MRCSYLLFVFQPIVPNNDQFRHFLIDGCDIFTYCKGSKLKFVSGGEIFGLAQALSMTRKYCAFAK